MDLIEYNSPLKTWPGTIKCPAYMTFPTLIKWEKVAKVFDGEDAKDLELMGNSVIPFICSFVKEWHISKLPETLTPEEFPGSAEFISWLIECISDVFLKTGETDPNSQEPSSATS